jgi:3,4-dihydroxy 2-butanone 4-phosphate synthase/GTP cyclohydrolase II
MLRVAPSYNLSSVDEVVEEFRNGRMVILVDDEERENEGDLVIPAQMATPEAINFMAKHGRGLICLALSSERVRDLGLELMPKRNESRHDTAFTVSVEAREGVTTGISASDRARTVAVAIDSNRGADDITSPGHVFPLAARDGGVLVRTGHTEASVDLARLAGLNPSAVICEIMNDDGTMARMPDLEALAQRHNIKIATIADLIAYRLRHDTIVKRIQETQITSRHGGAFRMYVYANTVEYAEHIALVKGDISDSEPVLVRVHDFNLLDDALGDATSEHTGKLETAMQMIGDEGRGIVIIIREPRQSRISELVRARQNGQDTGGLRDYGVGAQILLDLGVRDMILLHNTQWTIVGLDGYGLRVVDQRPIQDQAKASETDSGHA